jgi:hypothetical protein
MAQKPALLQAEIVSEVLAHAVAADQPHREASFVNSDTFSRPPLWCPPPQCVACRCITDVQRLVRASSEASRSHRVPESGGQQGEYDLLSATEHWSENSHPRYWVRWARQGDVRDDPARLHVLRRSHYLDRTKAFSRTPLVKTSPLPFTPSHRWSCTLSTNGEAPEVASSLLFNLRHFSMDMGRNPPDLSGGGRNGVNTVAGI